MQGEPERSLHYSARQAAAARRLRGAAAIALQFVRRRLRKRGEVQVRGFEFCKIFHSSKKLRSNRFTHYT